MASSEITSKAKQLVGEEEKKMTSPAVAAKDLEHQQLSSQKEGDPSGASSSSAEPPPSYTRESRPLAPPVFFDTISNTTTASSSSAVPPPPLDPLSPQQTIAPTPSAPFNFPIGPPPTYTPTTRTLTGNSILAIPQTHPQPMSPFLPAYPTLLQAHGITQPTWMSFLRTVSAFLSARTSRRALAHASDVAASVPKRLGKDLASTASIGVRNMGRSAKQLNPFGVVGSAIGLTMGVTGTVLGSVFGVPGAVTATPKTPRERVEAYLQKANAEWLHARGLNAGLAAMAELAANRDVRVERMVDLVDQAYTGGLAAQMQRLGAWVGDMVVEESWDGSTAPILQLGFQTLWLVIVRWEGDNVGRM